MSKEQTFSKDEILLSTTDLNSTIKYANPDFCAIAGYSLEELVGNYHNMVRSPSMPKAAFKDLWNFIQAGKSWMGPIKNQCKNGDYYWVNAFVTPIKDENGKAFEYQSVRTLPDREVVDRANQIYDKMNRGKPPLALKFQTDLTAWISNILMLITLFLIAMTVFGGVSPWFSIPLLSLSLFGSGLFFYWRGLYKDVLKEAKETFENPLMSYMYSNSNDQIGNIKLALKMKKAEIKAIVGRVADDSGSIVKAANQSVARGEEVSDTLKNQKTQTEQVSSVVNKVSETMQEIDEVVSNAYESSQQGLKISGDGHKVVLQTVSEIKELSKQLGEVDEAVDRLTKGTKAIDSVLGEISGIAEQTNLLALNAAIEAARAGEQGRGFAVVADEVRALAMRSQQSTEEIGNLLKDLSSRSEQAVIAMGKGNELSISCVKSAEKTGLSLTQINEKMGEVAGISTQITEAIEKQSHAVKQVHDNINAINTMSADSQAKSQEAVTLGEELLNRLNQQKRLIAQF